MESARFSNDFLANSEALPNFMKISSSIDFLPALKSGDSSCERLKSQSILRQQLHADDAH
ncbi:hypothetical protein JOE11_005350 [Robbsia andropogonis]